MQKTTLQIVSDVVFKKESGQFRCKNDPLLKDFTKKRHKKICAVRKYAYLCNPKTLVL